MNAMGKIKEISSTSNPIVKDIKGLALKKNRDAEGKFIVEGQKLVKDALEAGWKINTLIHAKKLLDDPGMSENIQALAANIRSNGGDLLIVTDKILQSITRRDNAQSCVAVMEQQIGTLADCSPCDNNVWIALDRVRDPGNLGTIIRTCDALGAKGVILIGETTDPFSLETVRATMGSLFHIPLIKCSEASFCEFAETFRAQYGGQLVGTHLKGAVDHRKIDFSKGPQILMMGNEQQGLTDKLAESCDQLSLISMAGAADSLNLAIATGIMLFEARRHVL